MSTEDKIREILTEKVDPVLAAHYGGSYLVRFEDDIAYVKLTGACATCPSAQDTIEDVVRNTIIGELPVVKDVILDNSISEDLLNMARDILSGKLKKPM